MIKHERFKTGANVLTTKTNGRLYVNGESSTLKR